MASFDFVRELIALGLDAVILTLCVREYIGHKRTISALKVRALEPPYISNCVLFHSRLINSKSTPIW